MEWKNKVAVITGAGGVLCGEIAKEYAAMGASVALLDINLPAAEKVAEEINKAGGVAVDYKADCLDKSSLQAVHEAVLKDLGKCDLLINGAGGNSPKGTATKDTHSEMTKEDISFFDLEAGGVDFVFRLNFLSAFLTTQVFAGDMIERNGNIVNISSGFFVTNQNRGLLFDKDGAPTARTRKILAGTPMGRFGESKEIMGALKWLTDNEQASFVTGIVIPIDGGFSAYSGV